MRLIKTYLFRLYVDTKAFERICGDIRPLNEEQGYPFKSVVDLGFILQQLVKEPPHNTHLQNISGSQIESDEEQNTKENT